MEPRRQPSSYSPPWEPQILLFSDSSKIHRSSYVLLVRPLSISRHKTTATQFHDKTCQIWLWTIRRLRRYFEKTKMESLVASFEYWTLSLWQNSKKVNFYWVKGTDKVPLCLKKHHVMKKYGGVEVMFHVLLTAALYGSEWSVSLYPREDTLYCNRRTTWRVGDVTILGNW
jgi:hypothetical protein